MKDLGRYLLAALIAAILAHAAIVIAAPRLLMGAAFDRIAQNGLNHWAHGERVNAQARGVVRPSPDLAYSSCAYDLSRGPLRISVTAWNDYMSLSLYAANSDNYFVISDRQAPDGVDLVLIRNGQRAPDDAPRVVVSPSTRGIALVRRLAPTVERFAAADAARQGDVCARLSP